MKQIKLTILLTALLSMVGARALAHDIEVKNADGVTIYYNWANNQTELSVSYRGSEYDSYNEYTGNVVIPESVTYNGTTYPVTSIGKSAFMDCYYLTNITIPNSVTSIGISAFYNCRSLTSVTIPRSVTSIDHLTFCNCSYLKNVTIPNSVRSIGIRAFKNCPRLTNIIIPNSVTSIEFEAFIDCSNLTTIIYAGSECPTGWVATTKTYVPNNTTYSSPSVILNSNVQIIEIINFNEQIFKYTGAVPQVMWTNNLEGYTATLNMSVLKDFEVGNYTASIPVVFSNGAFSFDAEIPYNYTINQATLTVKANNANRLYGDENPPFNVTYLGFLGGDNESVIINSPSLATIATKTSDIGDYPITATGGKAKNYNFVYEKGILTIKKAPLEAKVKDVTRQYGMANPSSFSITYTGLKNGETAPKWEQGLKYETTATKMSDVGTYSITATGTPFNYDLPKIENGTLTISQAPLTIKANNASRMYFENNPNFEYSCLGFLNNDNELVLTKVPTLTTEATKTSNVGKYKITPSGAETKNYSISYERGELSIIKRPLNVTSHYNRQYGVENPVFPIEYNGFVNDETESVITKRPLATTSATKTSPVGNYPITLSGGEAANYSLIYKQGVLTVTKATATGKVKDTTRTYGMQNPNFSIEFFGLKNGETAPEWLTNPSFYTNATRTSGVNKYAIKAINGVAKNYDLEITDGTLDITPAPLIIRANDATRIYYESEPAFTYTCIGFVNNESVQVLDKMPLITTNAAKSSNVGTYNIIPSGAEAKNYTISYEHGKLSISKRPLTVTSHCSRQYGEENPSFSIEYNGFVNNETESVVETKPIATSTANKTSPIGKYPITIKGGDATNYQFIYESGILTVTKASLSAKVTDMTKVYGTQNPAFTIEYYGLKNNETAPTWLVNPTFQTEATQYSMVGNYDVKAVNGVPANYELQIANGTLHITPAQLVIKANNATKEYYSENPSFSYSCSGFVNGDDESVLFAAPTLSTTANLSSKVGTYEIKVAETSCQNYLISYINGTLTIMPKSLIVSVNDYSRVYNEENPQFEVKCNGFVGGEDESVLLVKPTATTSATKSSDVGNYTIFVSGGSADNYTFSYSFGKLTINKAEQTISWEQDLRNLKIGNQVELTAVASSELPITYILGDNNLAEIYSAGTKIYLDCKAKGETQIMAVQNGNKNYYSSSRIRKTVHIGDGSSSVNSVTGAVVKIEMISTGIRVDNVNVGEMIRVYTSDGVLLKNVKAESQSIEIPLTKNHLYFIKVGTKTFKFSY